MGIKKSIQKLMALPTEMRGDEIIHILEYFGFRLISVRGSHHQFARRNHSKLTIPIHHNRVKKVYLRIIKRTIVALPHDTL